MTDGRGVVEPSQITLNSYEQILTTVRVIMIMLISTTIRRIHRKKFCTNIYINIDLIRFYCLEEDKNMTKEEVNMNQFKTLTSGMRSPLSLNTVKGRGTHGQSLGLLVNNEVILGRALL